MNLLLLNAASGSKLEQALEKLVDFGMDAGKDIFVAILIYSVGIIRKSKFPQNPKRSVRFSGKRTKRSVQKRKARNTQKAETKVL